MSLFQPPPLEASAVQPRPYQQEALEALDEYIRANDDNPCVVLPTGAGKSLVIAWAIQKWKHDYPPLRVMILAHRKELVGQNAAELRGLWPGGDIGIYAAGLGCRDIDSSVTYAMIDSVCNRAGEFPPFDLLLIDEAHRIPARGEGKYRGFIADCQNYNPELRVVGFTATPFRMGMGPICHKDHILNAICYEAYVGDLIRDGYLCRLRSKVGIEMPDLSQVRKNKKGEYVEKSLAEAIEAPRVVKAAVREAVSAIQAENRKCVVWFCLDVAHCKAVQAELRLYGIEAPYVTAKTNSAQRDKIVEQFRSGRYRHLLNINCYTEGFNVKQVDCVVLLRPTESQGLYTQMCGRGLRLHPDKEDCLVLDFARCISTHGPIDCLEAGEVRVIVCGSVAGPEGWPDGCGDTFSRALGACPHCGWKIPPREVAREEAERRERKLHEERAAQEAILGSEPHEVRVSAVTVHRHRKNGAPDSVKVQYRCGIQTFREWICLDHGGYAERKARAWWAKRFGSEAAKKVTVSEAVDGLFTAAAIQDVTEALVVVRRGRHWEIVEHKLRGGR